MPELDHPEDGHDQAATTTRRTVLRGVAIAGVGLPLLAACGGSSSSGDSGSSGSDFPVAEAKIPKGGGVIYGDEGVVVTQPQPGDFQGFSSTCTHQGCTLASVSGGTINCECHGSKFSIKDGSVVNGPATQPLPTMPLKVKNNEISLA